MKLRTFLAMAVILFLTACKTTSTYRATDDSVLYEPAPAQAGFLAQYPNATNAVWTIYDPVDRIPINWELAGWVPSDDPAYLVQFNHDNQHSYALYDMKGHWIGSAWVLTDYSVLPASVTEVLSIRFPAYTITGLSRVNLPGRMAYEVVLKKLYYTGTILIDDGGNVIGQRSAVSDHI